MDAKQFAWLYLIENGNCNQRPSYYGGWDVVDPNDVFSKRVRMDYRKVDQLQKEAVETIKKVGVDWEKTCAPSSDMVSRFTDTFHDPTQEEYLSGYLHLLDGTKQYWSAEALKVTNVFEMMADIYNVMNKCAEIFGESDDDHH